MVLILFGGLVLCWFLARVFDVLLNGVLLDWLDRTFVAYNWVEAAGENGEGIGHYSASIRWWRVKEYLFRGFVFLVLLCAVVGRLVVLMYAARREKKVIADVGWMIDDYMRHDRAAVDVFPPEYALVSVHMEGIKSSMQRHEQAMKEEAGRKNDLITYLAHDLKTPLTSVVGYLSLLEEAPDMPPEQKAKYVHIALDKALRLEKLINEFFEITRYNLQHIVLEKETVDLSFMLMQMTDEFYPILEAHGNTIRLELAEKDEAPEGQELTGRDNEIAVYADAEKLARVFNNILKNAVAYSYPDTEILVRCWKRDGKVMICFQNRGKTIPQQRLNAIFEKFYRLDEARTSDRGGAGLGLAIAREIVNLHGGTISAKSENELTSFTVELPADEVR